VILALHWVRLATQGGRPANEEDAMAKKAKKAKMAKKVKKAKKK
jgi:hypothetical protein